MTRAPSLPVRLIVQSAQIQAVGQHSDRDDGEGKYRGTGFQVSTKCFVWVGQGNVGVDFSAHHVAVHTGYISRRRGVLHEYVLGGEGAITDLVYLVVPNRSGARQDD